MAWVAILFPPPTSGKSSFLPHSPLLFDIWGVFWMQIVLLEAKHLFDLNATILGWLLAAVQPKKKHPRHNHLFTCLTPQSHQR
jgi:hypothetical protein